MVKAHSLYYIKELSKTYDALDNDIALLNVYFGESTAVGEEH